MWQLGQQWERRREAELSRGLREVLKTGVEATAEAETQHEGGLARVESKPYDGIALVGLRALLKRSLAC